MAEQGRYDRDYARGSYYDDDRGGGRGGSGRGDYDRDEGRSRRSDSLFGSGWGEREERGWGSSSSSGPGDDRGDHGRSERDRSSGSWFGGGDRSERGERSGSWLGGGADRERGRAQPDDNHNRERTWRPVDRDRVGRGDDRMEQGGRIDRDRDGRDDRMERGGRDGRIDRDHDGRDDRMERDRGGRDDRTERGGVRHGRDDEAGGLPIDETNRLIASNKVEGTAVYGLDGERLGSIYNFMVDKVGGRVEYAVMTYGGFLGMGTRYYPIPWQLLKYDTRRGGYRVDLTTRDLERAPSFDRSNEPQFDRAYNDRVRGWYGVPA